MEHQTVVIERGRIKDIHPAGLGPQRRQCRVLDGGGRFLVPGLADMHVHWWDASDAALYLANGVTLVRNMAGAPVHLAWAREIESGRFPGPRLVTTSPILDGPSSPGGRPRRGLASVQSPSEARRVVERFAREGYTQIKVYSNLDLAVLQALGQTTKACGLRLVGHCPRTLTFEQAIDAGVTCFEHLLGIERGHAANIGDDGADLRAQRLKEAPCIDPVAIASLASLLAGRQVWNCPTVVVWQAEGATADMPADLLKYVPARMRSWWTARIRARTAAGAAAALSWATLVRATAGYLHRWHAPLLVGTDTPNPLVVPGFSIHDELANLVTAGLSPYDVLRCATAKAAQFLNEAVPSGTISKGSRADLLLLRRNPLLNVGALKDLDAVLVNGYVLRRTDLDELLRWRVRRVAQPGNRRTE